MSWGDLLRVVAALAVLLPLAYVTARFAGSRLAVRPSRALRVVDALSLGPGRSLYLVEVGERLVLIGVSGQQMQPLACLRDPQEVAAVRRSLLERAERRAGRLRADHDGPHHAA
ncbi:MAG TPA: flagellar biosynthetic protein FliO [Limnochordales bacterium]